MTNRLNNKLIFLLLSILFINIAHSYVPTNLNKELKKRAIPGLISMKAPSIAENGAEVGIALYMGKLPKGVWIKEIILTVPYNKNPIARFKPADNVAIKPFKIRIKLRKTTDVYAYAILSNGKIYVAKKQVMITMGGCGGGSSIGTYYRSPTTAYRTYRPQNYTMPQRNTEKYQKIISNGVTRVAEKPVSTFSIDVDTGSYSNMRRFIAKQGQLPVKNAIRIEEMINYFKYSYKAPSTKSVPFSINTELTPSPWSKDSYLLRIGIKGYEVDKSKIPPANLVFLLDVSGSMYSPDKLPLLKSAMRLLTNQLSRRDKVSIVVYAGASGVILEPTSGANKQKINEAFAKLRAGGSTNGGAGIHLAYALAKKSFIKGGINRVIIATDGDFNVGTTSHAALIKLIKKKRKLGITLTTLGFGSGNYNDKLMEQLANHGNGNHAYIDSLKEANKVLAEELSSTLFTIAKDVKVQIEFNKNVVAEYRLIGYENRMLKREDFKNDKVDAGDLGAGHTVTAIYEISLRGSKGQRISELRYKSKNTKAEPKLNQELAFVKLRFKQPKGKKSKLVVKAIHKKSITNNFRNASTDFRFATAVAAFGQKLRGSDYTDTFSYDKIINIAQKSLGADINGYRREFVDLVKLAKALSPTASTKVSKAILP